MTTRARPRVEVHATGQVAVGVAFLSAMSVFFFLVSPGIWTALGIATTLAICFRLWVCGVAIYEGTVVLQGPVFRRRFEIAPGMEFRAHQADAVDRPVGLWTGDTRVASTIWLAPPRLASKGAERAYVRRIAELNAELRRQGA